MQSALEQIPKEFAMMKKWLDKTTILLVTLFWLIVEVGFYDSSITSNPVYVNLGGLCLYGHLLIILIWLCRELYKEGDSSPGPMHAASRWFAVSAGTIYVVSLLVLIGLFNHSSELVTPGLSLFYFYLFCLIGILLSMSLILWCIHHIKVIKKCRA